VDYQIIATELTTDPLARGYSGMTDEQVVADMNTVYRQIPRSSMSGDEIFSATDNTEFIGLTDIKRDLWVSFTGKDFIDPFGSSNVDFVIWVFGGGSTTVSSLQALRQQDVSRSVELIGRDVFVSDIEDARAN
jgi:hypothetical protein